MEEIRELFYMDFQDTHLPDGPFTDTAVICSDANFRTLIEEHNKLVRAIKLMATP